MIFGLLFTINETIVKESNKKLIGATFFKT